MNQWMTGIDYAFVKGQERIWRQNEQRTVRRICRVINFFLYRLVTQYVNFLIWVSSAR